MSGSSEVLAQFRGLGQPKVFVLRLKVKIREGILLFRTLVRDTVDTFVMRSPEVLPAQLRPKLALIQAFNSRPKLQGLCGLIY